MPVRVPLLYTWAVRNLVPSERVGTFEILRPRRHESIDRAFWRRRIGVRLNLGHIPAVARVRGEPCLTGPMCSSYLLVRFHQGRRARLRWSCR